MTFAAIIESLPLLLKIISYFLSVIQQTPSEKRRESLAELDGALSLAKDKNDLTELSKWFGKRL